MALKKPPKIPGQYLHTYVLYTHHEATKAHHSVFTIFVRYCIPTTKQPRQSESKNAGEQSKSKSGVMKEQSKNAYGTETKGDVFLITNRDVRTVYLKKTDFANQSCIPGQRVSAHVALWGVFLAPRGY